MTAFVLPNLDQSTIDELRKRIPDMSEIDVPSLEKLGKDAGKTADQAIDRLLGRNRISIWPWVAASIGVAALVGAVAAWFTWLRRPNSINTMVEEEMGTWQASNDGSGLTGGSGGDDSGFGRDLGTVTDQAIDRSTNDAIGAFGDRPADEYPTA